MKAILLLLILLFVNSIASAVDMGQIQDDTIFELGNDANITVLALQNFSQIIRYNNTESPPNTLEFVINNSEIQFNSTTDKIIYDITYNNVADKWTWKVNGSGYLIVNASILNTTAEYGVYEGTTLLSSSTWSSGNVIINISVSNATYTISPIEDDNGDGGGGGGGGDVPEPTPTATPIPTPEPTPPPWFLPIFPLPGGEGGIYSIGDSSITIPDFFVSPLWSVAIFMLLSLMIMGVIAENSRRK